MNTERKKAIQRLEQTKKAIRRDGFNRGVRAALRKIETYMQAHFKESGNEHVRDMACMAESIRDSVKRVLKPPLENPNVQIQGTQHLKHPSPK